MISKEKCLEDAINRIKYYNTDEPLKIVTVPFYDLEINALCDYFEGPTLSECIKEWNERGYESIYREKYIIFRHHKTYKTIEIYLVNLSYKTYEWYDETRPITDRLNVDEAQFITLELHNLIHKTLKALEENK